MNTKCDLGTCKRIHDQFVKKQFEIEMDREEYEMKFEEELMGDNLTRVTRKPHSGGRE